MSVNKAIILGVLGKDPEVKYLQDGKAVASFSIATSERWKDKNTGEQKEQTEWHKVTAFGKTAEIIGQYFKKGSKIYIEGKIKTRKWTDKEGVEKYTTEIHADTFDFIDKAGGNSSSANDDGFETMPTGSNKPKPKPAPKPAAPAVEIDDDIPF